MSTLQSDLEQNSSIHSETDVSSMTSPLCIILQNYSSIHSETDVSSMTSGEQLGTPNMSTLPSDLEQNSSIHSETDVSSMTSALCIIFQNSSIHSEIDVSSMASGEQLCEIEQSSPTPHEKSGTPKMSTLQSNLEQNSSIHWKTNVSSMTSGEQSSPTLHEQSGEEGRWKGDLCHAICVDSWNDAKAILYQNYPQALEAKLNDTGRTALHVAAMFGRVTIVKELLKLLDPQCLLARDDEEYTALTLACRYSGCAKVAKCLVNANEDLLDIPISRELPVTLAIKLCYIEMGRYLYSVTPLKCLKGDLGSVFLRYCFKTQCLDIALDLLQKREDLLLVPWTQGEKRPIDYIASLKIAIPSELVFWKRWIYGYINKPSAVAINNVCVDIQQEYRSQEYKAKHTQPGHGLLPRLIASAYNFVGVKEIQELKLQHAQADELLGLVCKNAKKAYQEGVMYEAFKYAAEKGNAEFVLRVSEKIPEIFTTKTFFTCLSNGLQNRHAEIFNLIYGFRFKQVVVLDSVSANEEDTALHRAATKASDKILNRMYAPTLKIQKELQWFKAVERLIPAEYRGFRNKSGKTGEEVFRETHSELMIEGEKWLKDTATSCSVVGTLIMTIMFSAAITVPGGNDQTLGYPLFIKEPVFKDFIYSTILSLLSSTISVLMFLAILTSQYSEEKFLKSLPTKLMLGLFFLFVSIVCMMIAFISTIHLTMKHSHHSWGILPIMILTSAPIFLFALSQFPLLLHTYVSTYGNLFDRNVKSWP